MSPSNCRRLIRGSTSYSRASVTSSSNSIRLKRSSPDYFNLFVGLEIAEATYTTALRLAALKGQVPSVPKDLFQQFMQVYLENYQNMSRNYLLQEEIKGIFLKARNPDFYSGNSYIECYYLFKQCKNYFKKPRSKLKTEYFLQLPSYKTAFRIIGNNIKVKPNIIIPSPLLYTS